MERVYLATQNMQYNLDNFLTVENLGLDLAKVFTMIGFNGLFFEFNCADMKFNINFLYRFLSFHGDWIRAYKLVLYT
jgi:hypothetical protein